MPSLLSAWEVSSAIRGLRAEMLICGTLARLATSDRESPSGLTRSGTPPGVSCAREYTRLAEALRELQPNPCSA